MSTEVKCGDVFRRRYASTGWVVLVLGKIEGGLLMVSITAPDIGGSLADYYAIGSPFLWVENMKYWELLDGED